MMMIYQKYIYSNLLLLILIVTVSSLLFHIKPLNYNVNYYNRIQRIHTDNISKRYMINNENIVENNNNNDIIKKWTNPLYEEEEVNKWFVDVGKSLLTIGSKGVTKSQINSLSELLKQHKRVRVKMANDKMDTKTISNEMINDEILLNKVDILQIRSREFMVSLKQQ